MKKLFDNLDKYLKFYFIFSIIVLTASILFIFNRVYKVEKFLAGFSRQETQGGESVLVSEVDVCGEDCKAQIEEIVSEAISTVSASKPLVQKETQTLPPEKRTAYISFAGPITTTSMQWVDAAGSDTYIDFNFDYGKNAQATWEAFLSIADGNGAVYARLYDATHGIAVNGSEISTSNASQTPVISGALSFWAGRNLYRVQIKSLNSFVATFSSGRIKIIY